MRTVKATVEPGPDNARNWKSWSAYEDRTLRREAVLEHPLDVIAKRHQRSEVAILSRMRKLKLKHPALTAAALAWQQKKARRELERQNEKSLLVKDLNEE